MNHSIKHTKEENSMKVFYHNDMDGRASAAIVFMSEFVNQFKTLTEFYKGEDIPKCPQFYEMDYNKEFPSSNIVFNENVIIVDYTPNKEEQKLLCSKTSNIIWIDHHKSTIDDEENILKQYQGKRKTDKAACKLTWEFYFPNEPVPHSIELIEDYDIWKFEFEETNKFQSGISLYDTHPTSKIWRKLLYPICEGHEIIEQGETILQYREQTNEKIIDRYAFYTNLDGYKVVACNSPLSNSQLFDSLFGSNFDFDIMSVFVFDGEKYSVSLYTSKKNIDVSKIAKMYGGGGHKGAAGFVCKELPFEKNKTKND